MTRNQSDEWNDSYQNKNIMNEEGTSLPPRSTKHAKRRDGEPDSHYKPAKRQERNEEQELDPDEPESGQARSVRTFPFIQIVFWSLISLIVFLILVSFYQEGRFDALFKSKEVSQQEEPQDKAVELVDPKVDNEEKQGVEEEDIQGAEVEEEAIQEAEVEENIVDISEFANSEGEGQATTNGSDEKENENEFPATIDTEKNEVSEPHIIAEHIVKPQETLYSITVQYYKSSKYIDDLAEFNGISDIRNIRAGMKIKIPEVKY